MTYRVVFACLLVVIVAAFHFYVSPVLMEPWFYVVLVAGVAGLAIFWKAGKGDRWPTWLRLGRRNNIRIIDTSVIIDGRIADICEAGFLDGEMIIPRFVLNELHYVADSADPLKRARGRRGLDILKKMQQMEDIRLKITDRDYPKIKGVDAKLIALARELDGKIITNDYNLNKVAQLQGIKVLNINLLANALKPVVMPGETLVVKIVREGREPGQGVGYLDDGTMIVVDNAQKSLGLTLEVLVTSVFQTSAGRMIFCEQRGAVPEKKPYVIHGNP